jgi:CDP-paratose 2-epimerase
VDDPKLDFDINVMGTIQLLEAIRSAPNPPTLIYTSTNKVYGALQHISLTANRKRYVPTNGDGMGIDETQNLNFHSPYGCSKGAADQYILDYSRTYGIRSAVFRMSCIYGPHQFGNEDEGWVAHIMSRAMAGKPITVYGDGRQVRDILFVEDLVDALMVARERISELSGEAFNIGGGPANSISLLEFLELLADYDARPAVSFSGWRIGDQKYYVSDTRKFKSLTGWSARFGIREGLNALHEWLVDANATVAVSARKAS